MYDSRFLFFKVEVEPGNIPPNTVMIYYFINEQQWDKNIVSTFLLAPPFITYWLQHWCHLISSN